MLVSRLHAGSDSASDESKDVIAGKASGVRYKAVKPVSCPKGHVT
jgi:hypothetical protein